MGPLDEYIRQQLNGHVDEIDGILGGDVMAIISPIVYGLEMIVRNTLELYNDRKDTLIIVLDTSGGVVEVVERMVNTIRNYYNKVIFIVPNRAMSAGTLFVMSGDRILMDFFSCLGPIDPQIDKDGDLIPALSYLNQYERLIEKSIDQTLTTAEVALLSKLDLGELHQFEQAKELSIELLVKWLSQYKFKDWHKTETRGITVTDEMRQSRAEEIATTLSDNKYWHSHSRGINMGTLINKLNLKIEDYSKDPDLNTSIKKYYNLLQDYVIREKHPVFVHTKEYF